MALGGIFNAIDYCFTAISAYASTSGIEMSATINPSSTITISANNVALDITPSVEGTFSSDYATVSTYTNTANNCTVTMTTASTNLTSGNNTIATLPGSVSEANFTNDRWGYRVGTSGDYNAVGASNQIATYAQNTGSSSALNLAIYFAAKLTPATKPGTYTDTVTFISTCAPDPIPVNINNLEYMQDFATLTDSEMTELLDSMVLNQQYQLKDNRDEKEYYIAKLADGNVWMTQNLDHDIVTTENFYTYANTDIGHGSTPDTNAKWTANAATHVTNDTAWAGSNTILESSDPGNLCWDGTFDDDLNPTYGANTEVCGSDRHYHIGNYYNWTAAIAMNDSSGYIGHGMDANQSICPAGWTLPYDGDGRAGNKSFYALKTALGLDQSNYHNAPIYFVYGGGNGVGYVGAFGVYWSPETYFSWTDVDNTAYAYSLFLMIPNQHVSGGTHTWRVRSGGYSVRCVNR